MMKFQVTKCILYALLALWICPEIGQTSAHPWRDEDLRQGYEEEISMENEEVGELFFTVSNPTEHASNIQDHIFNQKISREFQIRYAEQFGRSSPEVLYNRTPYLNSGYTESQSLLFDEVEYQKKQKKFGNFMFKRLIEFHLQNEAKTNPQLKTVNTVKESVEKVDLSFSKNFKIRAKYHISSNTFRLGVVNPYIDISMRMEFSGAETVISMQKEFSDYRLRNYLDYYVDQNRLDFTTSKVLGAGFNVSLLVSPFRDIRDSENRLVVERVFIGGVGFAF